MWSQAYLKSRTDVQYCPKRALLVKETNDSIGDAYICNAKGKRRQGYFMGIKVVSGLCCKRGKATNFSLDELLKRGYGCGPYDV